MTAFPMTHFTGIVLLDYRIYIRGWSILFCSIHQTLELAINQDANPHITNAYPSLLLHIHCTGCF